MVYPALGHFFAEYGLPHPLFAARLSIFVRFNSRPFLGDFRKASHPADMELELRHCPCIAWYSGPCPDMDRIYPAMAVDSWWRDIDCSRFVGCMRSHQIEA